MQVWFFTGKQVLWWCLTCLAAGIYLGALSGQLVLVFAPQQSTSISGKTIVIDAGHGGTDPGAVSSKGILEKDVTLKIAKELEWHLQKAAVVVVMIRTGDYDLADPGGYGTLERKRQDLQRRVMTAEEAQADLFISIHANYFPSPVWSGAQTFYFEGKTEGQILAHSLQTELVKHLGPNHRLARPGNYRVLRETTMPAALVEVGFLSNPREAELLAEEGYQKKVAAAIFAGILRYYDQH